jgi:hypothetical protein
MRYNAAKRHDTTENWKKYRKSRIAVRRKLTEACDDYIRGNLNQDTETDKPSMGKRFWMYIKSRKKDTVPISILKDSEGNPVINNTGKVQILNQQYGSVFTDEDLSNTPNLGRRNIPSIDKPYITEKRVTLLLKKLDTTKATGPDLIPTRILKKAADEITPFLTSIFNQSMTSEVPIDWKLANISAIY